MKAIAPFASVLALGGALVMGSAGAATAAGDHHFEYQRVPWSFSGIFGQYDQAQLQRGFQVFQQACSACHGLERLRWRNLVQPGGPEFPEEAIKKLALEWPNQPLAGPDDEGRTTDAKGNLLTRPAILADPILGPYRNEKEARAAQNGALPPDLTMITKARGIHDVPIWYAHVARMGREIFSGYGEAGSDYVYNLLMSYADPPADFKLSDGMNYNKAYPGNQIAMVQPLLEDNPIKYEDGSGTKEQNVKDVVAFLSWAADPKLNERKAMGWSVMIYLLITCVLLYVGKKRIWARAGGH
jgi:cytochrome c1